MLNQTTNLKLLIVTAFCLRVSERDCVLVAPVLCFAGRNYHLTTKLSLQRASTSSHGPYRLYDHHSVTAFVKGSSNKDVRRGQGRRGHPKSVKACSMRTSACKFGACWV